MTYVLFTYTDANVSHLARISWTGSHVPSSYRLLYDTKRYVAMALKLLYLQEQLIDSVDCC